VPADGAVIFAGNHPNALMDGWLLTEKCGRWPLHFMASAKLWRFPVMGRLLDASGAVPVYRREEHGDDVDNSAAFEALYDVIESGNCMGVFPEGISHAESQLATLKTGTARIALAVAARGKTEVRIIPVGLNYMHRHRFRSQVLIEFGEPIVVGADWAARYRSDERAAVAELTDLLAASLKAVTLNAPDWTTLKRAQIARRLYKPSSIELTPQQYVELNRRFVEAYLRVADDPDMQAFRAAAEEYQARLDMLGLKDYQLRHEISQPDAIRRALSRFLTMLLLLPVAIPGGLLHLPVGWIASLVGERFSYEMDDIATLKVFATILLLPLIYAGVATVVGVWLGWPWGVLTLGALFFSFAASIRLLEAETSLLVSMLGVLKLARFSSEVAELRRVRADLVKQVRGLADRFADPSRARLFTRDDFSS
jgi:glycerol-3-phosphate O-acyltransferase/dihydroxyacetone phosphate acyltransferase